MLTAPTFAAALVSGLRTHGHRPSGPDGRAWSAIADEARTLALGLGTVGVGPGTVVRVRRPLAAPAAVLAAEVAVLASGATLAVDDVVPADHVLDADALRPGTAGGGANDPAGGGGSAADGPAGDGDDVGGVDGGGGGAREGLALGDVRRAGIEEARRRPAGHEEALAAIDPASVALRGAGLVATHAQAVWALRCVTAWLGPATPDGPRTVLATPPDRLAAPVPAALVGRWWPAAAGALLAPCDPDGDVVATARSVRPHVVVGDRATWEALVEALRAEAARSRAGSALLRRGRALVAGEVDTRAERAGRTLAERRAGVRIRSAAGLEGVALGVCLGPLDVATGRDLAAAGLPVVATWIDPGVPAPVAAGPRARPTPAEPWGRPLPGRSIDVGPPPVVHGGDVDPAGIPASAPTEVDARARVRLPRVAARAPGEHAAVGAAS